MPDSLNVFRPRKIRALAGFLAVFSAARRIRNRASRVFLGELIHA